MIPKTIHYTWFGKKDKPKEVVDQINQWKKVLPDYQIKEWNEKNYDLYAVKCDYVRQAIKANMWAFVSDYVRLDILNSEGGIYLDTDVEVITSFNPLLINHNFIGMESNYAFSTAVIGSESNQEWLKELLADYSIRSFQMDNGQFDKIPNSKYIFSFFQEKYNFRFSEQIQSINKVKIYPVSYFSPINYSTQKKTITDNTFSIHHYSGTWKSRSSKIKDLILLFLSRLIGENRLENIKKLKRHFKQ
ncbi:glycosyltransferase [Leuconostoc citreum]|uniref:glycosyltransferase family 32 protein n=1 Tax=Leuconostoc citreum TaxID=33964 RepID=UPI0021A76245|nr:glycosyltransferase [Leuconostoc citreum]MCT3075006.1 glycosyltransferase [Leuconostoc citreum]